jgi:hypothetical protein
MKNLETILKMQSVEEIHNFIKLQIFENTNVKTSKFNIFNYCIKPGKLRPDLTGVFHDKGQRVATDTHQIAVIKCDYLQEYEGKIIDKEGKEIEGKFPNYEAVLPKLNNNLTEIIFNIDEIKNQFKQYKAFKKIDKNGENPHFKFNLNGTYFNIELLFEKALPFIELAPAKMYLFNVSNHPRLYVVNDNGDKYLQMPMYK